MDAGKNDLKSEPEDVTTLRALLAALDAAEAAHRRAVDTLQADRERLETILQTIGDGVVVLDAGGSPVTINNAAARMVGFASVQEALTDPATGLFDRVHISDEDGNRVSLADLPRKETDQPVVLCFQPAGGSEPLWVQVTSTPVRDAEGELVSTVHTLFDFTTCRRVELEQARLISELQAFGHTVAHDLQSPLSIITSYLQFWAESEEELSADMREQLHMMRQYALKMHKIIDDLFLLANVRHVDIPLGPLHMDAVVDEALKRLQPVIEDSDARISRPEDWPEAVGYAPWVEAVWVNYISNAVRYGGRPPEIQLGAERLDETRARFWVRDNGRGIPLEDQAKLFQPFSRTTRPEPGTGHGLGLSIVYRIIEKLGGEVGVDSEVGKGSRFWFVLAAAGDDVHEP